MLALSLIMFSYLFDGKVDLSCVGSLALVLGILGKCLRLFYCH